MDGEGSRFSYHEAMEAAPADARPRVCVLERNDFAAWTARHSRGQAAGALPYGLDALEERFRLLHPFIDYPSPLRWALSSVEYRTDREVGQVLASLGALRTSDACLSIFEDFGLTFASLARVLRRLPPLVLMSCWMSQRLLTFAHQQRAGFRRLVQLSEVVTLFSGNQVPLVSSLLGVPKHKLHVVPFGVVTDYFVPAGEGHGGGSTPGYVAVAGQDAGRDWPTFFQAAAANPEVRFRLAAWPKQMAGYDIPPNVEMLGGLPTSEYRALLQGADFVVVASHPLPYPTGQSVLLESLSCGRPVVAARSPAMRDYLDHDAVETYEAGDAGDLAAAVRTLVKDERRRGEMAAVARQVVLDRFDSRRMWAAVAELIDSVL